jgi:hypothetical protein
LSPADCFPRCGDAQKFSSMNADHGKPDGDCISLCNNLVDFKTSVLKNLMTIPEICDVLRETRYALQARRDVSCIIIVKATLERGKVASAKSSHAFLNQIFHLVRCHLVSSLVIVIQLAAKSLSQIAVLGRRHIFLIGTTRNDP